MNSMITRQSAFHSLSRGFTKSRTNLLSSTRRSYTDYHNFNYPELKQYSVGYTIFFAVSWFFFLRCGHVDTFTGRNDWKHHILDSLDKYKDGVINGDEFEYIESFFQNLPDRAE